MTTRSTWAASRRATTARTSAGPPGRTRPRSGPTVRLEVDDLVLGQQVHVVVIVRQSTTTSSPTTWTPRNTRSGPQILKTISPTNATHLRPQAPFISVPSPRKLRTRPLTRSYDRFKRGDHFDRGHCPEPLRRTAVSRLLTHDWDPQRSKSDNERNATFNMSRGAPAVIAEPERPGTDSTPAGVGSPGGGRATCGACSRPEAADTNQ